jgi:hypothetical protein
VRGIPASDLLYCEFCCGNDRDDAFAIPFFLGPTELELTRFLPDAQRGACELREAEPRGLQDGRNGGANDIPAVFRKIGVPGSAQSGESPSLVAAEAYLEHGRGLRKPDFRDSYFGVGLTVTAQLSDALLRLIVKD